MANKWIDTLVESRFWALARKEVSQILRNRQLIFLLVFPPTIQLLIFGFALSPDVRNLKLGVVDHSHSSASRELVSAFTNNSVFRFERAAISQEALGRDVRQGKINAALVIPPDFSRTLSRDSRADVQVFVDAVDANTAGIVRGYTTQIINQYSAGLATESSRSPIATQVNILYNPGLRSSWFFIPGVIGLVLTLTSSLVSSATVVREKDFGTLEQLLMTPARDWEILLAKVVPLFVMLIGEVFLALGIARVVFGIPVRGSLLLFIALSALYILAGTGIGTLLAVLSRDQRQTQLVAFFITLPLIQLSGALSPIESIPPALQFVSLFNPMRHYVEITRALLLRGAGLDVLWPHALALALSAIVLFALSAIRFRSQLR